MIKQTAVPKKNSRDQYHHGDLYESLLSCATEIIGEGGVEALSMRKLADKVGVSRTAPYHHFKDKNELLCAIAEQGFQRQELILNQLIQDSIDSNLAHQFAEYVHTYIQLAHENRDQYDLMFGREIWRNSQPTNSLKDLSHQHFQNWLQWIDRLQKQGIIRPDSSALRTAQVTWATLHGICRLLNDGIYTEHSTLQEMGQAAINMILKEPNKEKLD